MDSELVRLENQAQVSTYSAEWHSWEPEFAALDWDSESSEIIHMEEEDWDFPEDVYRAGRFRQVGNEIEFQASIFVDTPFSIPSGYQLEPFVLFSLPVPSAEYQLLPGFQLSYDESAITLMHGRVFASGEYMDEGAAGVLACVPIHPTDVEWNEEVRNWAVGFASIYYDSNSLLWAWDYFSDIPEIFTYGYPGVVAWSGRYLAA